MRPTRRAATLAVPLGRGVVRLAAIFALASFGPLALLTISGVAQLRSLVIIAAAALGLSLCAGLVFLVFALQARHSAEKQLGASEHRFKQLVEALPMGLFVMTPDGKPYLANREAQRLLGKGADPNTSVDELAQTYEAFIAGTDELYPTDKLPVVRAMHGEYSLLDDMEIRRGEGDVVPLEVRGAPIYDADGELMYAVAMFTDITERREAQRAVERAKAEAERANHAKSVFLSRMSHELRTPLNAILGFAQILDMDERSEEDTESIHTIMKGGRHLLDLINELLDIARVEAGELPLSMEVVEVDEALREAIELIRPMAEQRAVRLSEFSLGDGPHYVTADRQRLKQVLLNLLSNAVKYNRDAGKVTASVENGYPHGVRITIADTGHGLSADQLDRVFAPFDRLGAEQSTIEGTGLGLTLTKSLIELMGGEIGVESSPGDGSTFWIELPVAHSPLADVTPLPPHISHDPLPEGPNRTVLCIEDNVSSIKLLERVFEHRPNIRMLAAAQGSLGLDLARLHYPDLILLDLNLPDTHGINVLAQLSEEPETAKIPVVVMSADATPGQIQRLMDAGARDYLTKPIDVAQCLELLDSVFADSKTGA